MFSPRSYGRFAGMMLLAVVVTTCRSAAAVILDLPEPGPETSVVRTDDGAAPGATPVDGPVPGTLVVDTVRPAIESLTSADSILATLPRHSSGIVDWVSAVRFEIVKPRDALPGGQPSDRQLFGYDFYFGEFEVYFPHSAHTEWLTCGNCHPGVFRGPGSGRTSMKEISEGKACGACHGKVAFGVDVCERCHPALGLAADRIEPELAVDVVIPRDSTVGMTEQFAPSLFPHWIHRIRYRCSTCHDALFKKEIGSNGITMEQIQNGESCGTCHDDVTAFGGLQCARCHAPVPEPVRLPEPDTARADPADTG